jgi:hypothetical protein
MQTANESREASRPNVSPSSFSLPASRWSVVLLALALASATGIAARALQIDPGQSQILQLALGVFAGFASALTFALALLATTVTQWPPMTALIIRPPLLTWAGLSLISVSLAFVDSFSHHPVYVSIALASTVAAATIGTAALIEVLSVVGGSERLRFHGRLLARAIRKCSSEADAFGVGNALRLREDFLSAAAANAAHDTSALIGAFEVLINAANAFRDEGAFKTRHEGEAILRLLLEFQMLLPKSMQRGEALDESARLIGEASGRLAVISGRLAEITSVDGPTPACWLAAQTRTHNWMALCAAATAEQDPSLVAQCERVIARVREAQTIILRCVDPDPPLEVIPATHPWHDGVRDDPMGLMVWYSTAFEYHGIIDNNSALYVAHESLLKRKTTGSYTYGYILRDLEQGVEENESLRARFADHGGFTEILLDVLACCLATCSQGSWRESQHPYAGDGWVTDGARSRAERVAWIVPHGPEQSPTMDGILDMVVRAVSRAENLGFERYRRDRLATLKCKLQPPWARTLETPIFHLAAGALVLASWAKNPGHELEGFGDRIGSAGRRASKAVLDEVLGTEMNLREIREVALNASTSLGAVTYSESIVGYLNALR